MATNYQEILQCRKCNDNLSTNLKYLGCLHIFCAKCLNGMITTDSCVKCGICKAKTQLDQLGINGLPPCKIGRYSHLIKTLNEPSSGTFCHSCKSNDRYASLYCYDCQFLMCDECHLKSHKVFQAGHLKVLKKSDMKCKSVDEILELIGLPECDDHPGNIANYFDTTYNTPVCEFHDNETGAIKPISSVVKERHKTIHDKMNKSLRVAELMKSRLNDLSALKITISKDESETIDSANEYFDNLLSCVEIRRQEVLNEIKTKSKPSFETINNEMEKQEKTIEKYFDAQQYIQWNLETLPKTFLIKDFEAIDWYLGHFNDKRGVKTATLKDLHSLEIPQFQHEEHLENMISKTVFIEGGNSPKSVPKLASKPRIVERTQSPQKPPPRAMPLKKKTSIINLTDTNGKIVQPWEIVSDFDKYYILDRETNNVHVANRNGHIFDTLTIHILHARRTWGLAYKNERLFVSDIHYNHVIMMDPKGQVLSIIHKTDRRAFGHPTGLAINNIANCVAIVDNYLKKVHIFTLTPRYKTSLGGDWLDNPTAICVDNSGNFIVLDTSDPLKFVVLNIEQNFVKHIYPPFEEIAIGQPQSILVNTNGYLCWSDSSTHSIVVVRDDGSLVDIFGAGKDDGISFKSPVGICLDFRNNLVVCDAMSNCLVVL